MNPPLLTAEQAVLGAVLLEPDQLAHLDWLAPEHFYRPVHQALFGALRKLRADGHPTVGADGLVPLSWVTDAVDEASLHVRGVTEVYAHRVISACPRPEHAPVYGRMVLEGAIHRTVAQHAIRLHQAARADAVQGEVEGVLRSADVLTGVLTDLARRWGTDPRPVEPTAAPATGSATSPVRAAPVAEDERFLLAVLAEQPQALDEVVPWLRPADFADPAHGQVYRCLGALRHRGEPIDRITLLWEAQRRGLLADGTLSGDQIAGICDGVPGSSEWFADRVMRASLTRTAVASARAVRALAEDETLGPGRLINHALHALGPLDEVRARWATANEPPKRPAPAPARGGPPPARAHAARARSTTHPSPSPPARPGPVSPPPATRPPARGHL
ncbi:helicase DnaB [Streptomyces sp. CHA1]|uniref:DnaB-like helicase N-terminal domain-containing protein n=1 Tax=Streptomyces TaxID=1883 RepID=UPI001BFC9118|nr:MULTISPECIES: DnaB-like helicase N-terminal domain-containing protein [unclassified Streptomyces]MBT3160140.1 helicase DnaB [Streptomyces sp. G11C]MCO6704308.1 helicase DnaB [Streptomyces sp. CHB9.2]MCO6710578.1 helicase DnaB [Streptomyces sp. CHA3]MCO6716378.1 helicase DnaB [Streptomyces sp. CHB19.2]MCO6722509.1 helicase DnaB [Streptomyces sp. Vc714c-19]